MSTFAKIARTAGLVVYRGAVLFALLQIAAELAGTNHLLFGIGSLIFRITGALQS